MLEARCHDCGEHFTPEDEEDLEHVEREDGSPCGGLGEVIGGTPQTLAVALLIQAIGPVEVERTIREALKAKGIRLSRIDFHSDRDVLFPRDDEEEDADDD